MKITPLLITVVIFSTIMFGMAYLYSDLSKYYGTGNNINDANLTSFQNISSSVSTKVELLSNQTKGLFNKPDIVSMVYDMSMAVLNIAGVLLEIPSIFTDIMIMMSQLLVPYGISIPEWIVTMISLIVMILVVLRVVALFAKVDEV